MGRKWSNIKEKKAARDKNVSRIYAKFGRKIYQVAKQGEPDPEANQQLKFVLEQAKTYNVPKHIIDKAIDKAKGGGEENFDELRYEGFGPDGSMIIVEALTNNVNRTASEVRAAFGKNGGNMGVSGSVTYMFDQTAIIGVQGVSSEDVMEWLMEADLDARDILEEEDQVILYTEPEEFHAVQSALINAGVNAFSVAEIEMLPQTEVTLQPEAKLQFDKLVDALEELDDVQQVYHNVNMADENG
ncbi:YebC/PmpR family DNA-binding transcriptional regulator [Salisediminibacterium selenitireducens]|uniref:Probable transcriptional regulatory protein Bsel_2566 n=1 Tax=Bacillus selenitireducens (strain ATCC 700615 / DSM 15326 / MLS10) TaxID=439292 RepID=D6XXM4_BACIE|nr:YebC/PmpR family DNA-binding transcriptional regulator [Salisediminibacterium selenitireducens]ADI00067.1 protein of unknown function DUF28 [[Bacillus] selenitireducens MLS10]